jgi:hypothetical protein
LDDAGAHDTYHFGTGGGFYDDPKMGPMRQKHREFSHDEWVRLVTRDPYGGKIFRRESLIGTAAYH